MPKIDLDKVPVRTGSSYPAPHDAAVEGRSGQRLGDAGGLTQFGVTLTRLAPGAASSLRHWHEKQDEFIIVTEGELTLVEDGGETVLKAGDCAAFPAGVANGHCVQNLTDKPGAFFVVGAKTPQETAWYSDIDMKLDVHGEKMRFTRRDGSPLDGGPAPEAPEADFQTISERLTRGLLNEEFGLYRSIFHLPSSVHPRTGDAYTLNTEAELKEDYDLYVKNVKAQGVTAVGRKVLKMSYPDNETCVVETEVTLMRGSELMVKPFNTVFRLEKRNGEWRIARIISSLGHIAWTRGQGGVTADQRFELD
jgi:uncharacterized cupin superfamily protein